MQTLAYSVVGKCVLKGVAGGVVGLPPRTGDAGGGREHEEEIQVAGKESGDSSCLGLC